MNFLLGIFTGIAFCLFYGNYLNNKRKKEQDRDRTKAINELKKVWSCFRISPEDLEFLNSSHPRYPLSPAHAKDLNAQIKAAIESENFEEAARLRDLINRK